MELWGWNMPGINRHEFAEMLREPIHMIQALPTSDIPESDLELLRQYPVRIQFIRDSVFPNLPGGNAFHAYLTVKSAIDGLTAILARYSAPEIDWKAIEDQKLMPASQVRRLKQLAGGISKLSTDSTQLNAKIAEINSAHAAAEALPANMQDLADAQKAFMEAGRVVEADRISVETAKSEVQSALQAIAEFEAQASAKVANIDDAYSAATTQGLGKAFGDRAKSLNNSIMALGVVLAITLGVGACISSDRIEFVHQLMKDGVSSGHGVPMDLLWVNVSLTVVSVAAPIWLAWLLTKQIGQRFRLAEDYGFKAAVAKAYEGYRREAMNVDREMAKRLLGLALDRIDEPPLRLVEKATPGGPIQELWDRFGKAGAKSEAAEETQ